MNCTIVDGEVDYSKRRQKVKELLNKSYDAFFVVIGQEEMSKVEVFYLNEIKSTIINYYEKIDLMFDYEKRYILNTTFPSPIFVPKSMNPQNKNDYILLSIDDLSYWCQVIYQLSHELTHCFIHCNSPHENKKILWIEETICEAMSLYFLEYFAKHWNKSKLSSLDSNYYLSIRKYLNDLLKGKGTNKLIQCNSIAELKLIEKTCQQKRKDRNNEMIQLYELIKESDIIGLIKYRDYAIKGTVLLDTDLYEKDFSNNKAVKYLCNLQRNIISMKNKEN